MKTYNVYSLYDNTLVCVITSNDIENLWEKGQFVDCYYLEKIQ